MVSTNLVDDGLGVADQQRAVRFELILEVHRGDGPPSPFSRDRVDRAGKSRKEGIGSLSRRGSDIPRGMDSDPQLV